jgi:hypothetical protein
MNEDPSADAKTHLKQGLGLLWRAAREAAGEVRKAPRGEIGRSIDDAGRELARAASNVLGRLAGEVKKPPPRPEDKPRKPGDPHDDPKADPDKKKKPTGPTPEDPGFSIMSDDDDKPR